MSPQQGIERSMLDGKDREELHSIASAIGLKGVTRLKKADLVDAILSAAGGDGGGDGAKAKKAPAAKAAVREAWRTYMPLRGDTENHWAMYYTSMYLMSQLWPDDGPEKWFNGKSSKVIHQEAKEYLEHWMRLTTTIGQGEYDCTHYLGEYSIPMLYLATWAEDPVMRQRGRMMLDYLMADFAVDTLNGIYIGAHARTDDTTVREKWNGLSSFFAWLFLGNCPLPMNAGGWGHFFAMVARNYELPEVIYRIGTDRPESFSHFEKKRTRHRWRSSEVRNAPVYKTSYVTRDYAVGSDQGEIGRAHV